MVRRVGAGGEGGECIAVFKTPFNDARDCRDGISFRVVLQNNSRDARSCAGGDAVDHIGVDNRCVGGFTGVTGGNVPVEVLVAVICGLLGQSGHDAGVVAAADGIGAASREAEHGGIDAGLFGDDGVLSVEVRPVGVFT